MQTRTLISIELVSDDETGIYQVGEFDFSVPIATAEWLNAEPKRAQLLAHELRDLATRCEARQHPFAP